MPSKIIKLNSVNDPDIWGRRPLYYAVRRKDIEAVQTLISNGADPLLTNHISGGDEDLLITAFRTSSVDIINCVMGLLANDSRSYVHQNIATYIPFIFRDDALVLEQFIRMFEIRSFKGYESILCKAAKKCHYDTMLRYNICFDLQSALKYALVYSRLSVFQYLLTLVRYREQLDHLYRGPHGSRYTLLSLCASIGYYAGIQQLIKMGADITMVSVNERGETRNNLMATVDNPRYNQLNDRGQLMIKKCLHFLAKLYDINSQNSRGQTALMFAHRAGNADLAQILLDLGADPTIPDMDGNLGTS